MKNDIAAFLPGVGGADPLTRFWLRQVTLRLRREVCWLWRERAAQGVSAGLEPATRPADLPPFANSALAALDLARFADARRAFFADDITARHLTDLLAEPAPHGLHSERGSIGWVVDALRLAPVDAFVLALALLPAVDSAAGPVIATCLNEPGRAEPTWALAQRLWDAPDEVLRCLDPRHALSRHGLLAATAAAPGWSTALQMPALVAAELLFPCGTQAGTQPPRRHLIPVLGGCGAALASMQADDSAGPDDLAALMTVAWLRGATLYLPPGVPTPADRHHPGPAPLPLPALPLTVYVGVHDRAEIQHLGADVLPPIRIAAATHADRLAAWQRVLPDGTNGPLLADLSRRFRCNTATIERIGAELALLGRTPTADELLAATRADLDLGALAQPVTPRFGLAELMLPAPQTRQLTDVVTAMRNLGRTHHDWGTARAWSEGGLAVLFAGPPGTGKTMASEAVAHELGLPLYRIDLSQVVNKYIGETEKNLRRLFDAADAADAVLLFDEADALFGKRTEVKDAHDRYANLEISYLLERMERFKGLAILATNRRKDLDDAFLRRLRFVVEFPLPGPAERERIWRGVIPQGVDASALDFDFLARRFTLAGGHIRGIVFQACLLSASAGAERRLTMAAVVRAVQREYDKLERAYSVDQFGPYAPLAAADEALQ